MHRIWITGSSASGKTTLANIIGAKLNLMFNFEKNIAKKLWKDIKKVQLLMDNYMESIGFPRYRLHAIFNYPNKVLGKGCKHKICLDKEKCINCNKCIHHCPNEAIILSKKTRKKPKFNNSFFKKYKEKILRDMEIKLL